MSQSSLNCLTPCNCKTTGHEFTCWLSHAGYYVNGVKVAPLYFYVSSVVQMSVPWTISWPEK